MRAVEATVTTSLTVQECAQVFQQAAGSLRGGAAKLGELAYKANGAKPEFGFYTPQNDSPFASVQEQPAFAIGFKFASGLGVSGRPGDVHMYVWDRDDHREAEIVSQHGMGGRGRSEKIVGTVVDGFRSADRAARVS